MRVRSIVLFYASFFLAFALVVAILGTAAMKSGLNTGRFEIIEEHGWLVPGYTATVYEKNTGVMYQYIYTYHGIDMCALINADGTPQIYENYNIK